MNTITIHNHADVDVRITVEGQEGSERHVLVIEDRMKAAITRRGSAVRENLASEFSLKRRVRRFK